MAKRPLGPYVILEERRKKLKEEIQTKQNTPLVFVVINLIALQNRKEIKP